MREDTDWKTVLCRATKCIGTVRKVYTTGVTKQWSGR